MMGMSSEDSNHESSDDAAYKKQNVEKNAAVEENMMYKEKNLMRTQFLCWSLLSLLSFLVPFPNNRSKTMKNWLQSWLQHLRRCLRRGMLMDRWLRVMLLSFLSLLVLLAGQH